MASISESFSIEKVSTRGTLTLTNASTFERLKDILHKMYLCPKCLNVQKGKILSYFMHRARRYILLDMRAKSLGSPI